MPVVLVTGAATGIGNLTARALAAAGHTVYASMRDLAGRNAEHAGELLDLAQRDGSDLRVVELDVQYQDSADQAVETIISQAGRLDAVVHNAGQLAVGYVEAFTAVDIAHLFDVNVLGAQRVNRAALPHMRRQSAGTLVYIGTTLTVSMPPFLGPYVATKAAFDALAQETAYEVGQFGIETAIVMPGLFPQSTEHFPNASGASDEEVTRAYSGLDAMMSRHEAAVASLFQPGTDDDPGRVAEAVAGLLALPAGQKPNRRVVDFTGSSIDEVNAVNRGAVVELVSRMGLSILLDVNVDVPHERLDS